MRGFSKCSGIVAAALLLGCAGLALADDEDALAKAPAAVQTTVKSVIGKNTLAGFDPETDNGKTVYEVSYELSGGGDYTIIVNEAGDIIQREVEIDPSIIPPAVIDAAKKAQPTGTPSEYAIINADGKLFYEIESKVGKDNHEIKISPTGQVLGDTIAAPEAADAAPEKDEKTDAAK